MKDIKKETENSGKWWGVIRCKRGKCMRMVRRRKLGIFLIVMWMGKMDKGGKDERSK